MRPMLCRFQRRRRPRKNRDLREAFLAEATELAKLGDMKLELWKIPRESNSVADAAAKEAAEKAEVAQYAEAYGVFC